MPPDAPHRPKKHSKLRWFVFIGLLTGWLLTIAVSLAISSTKPIEAILVLGGSIRREIYVAELAKQLPQVPVLISQGSPHPCIWLIFQRSHAPMQQVWLENCARSTFGNFYFSGPILRQWRVHKVRVVTSGTQLTRARVLAQILLGAQGIWVEIANVEEQGIPGNQESALKTSLDITRSLGWAVVSPFYSPTCGAVMPLTSVDIEAWRQRGFSCERQGNLGLFKN